MQSATWLRAIAALLIVNSHLESQHLIPQAAVDGLLGNSLFFFLAGQGLVASERGSRRGFSEWYGRRLLRIVPSVFLAVLVLDYLPHQGWRHWSAAEHLRNFLAPPGFTFVEQILVLYVPFFAVQRLGGRRGNAWALVLLTAAMLATPLLGRRSAMFHPFHWLYYFQMMLFGAWVGWRDEPAGPVTPRLAAGFAMAAVAYGAAKLAGSRPAFAEWYPAVHLLVFPLVFCGVRASRAEGLARFVARHRRLGWALGLVGGLTLEIYLVHYAVRDGLEGSGLPFPANIAAIVLGSVVLAAPLAAGAEGIRRGLRRAAAVAANEGGRRPLPRTGPGARDRLPGGYRTVGR